MTKKQTRNQFEEKIFKQLKKANCVFEYESKRIPYILSGYYLPDFIINTPNGLVYVETKGYFRPEAKRKMIAVKKQHSELDIRILFYAHNPKNIKWAEKNGFKYAVDVIPTEWLNGF